MLSGVGCNTDKTIFDDLTDIKAFIAAGGHAKELPSCGADGKYVEAVVAVTRLLWRPPSGNFVDATGITDGDSDTEQSCGGGPQP